MQKNYNQSFKAAVPRSFSKQVFLNILQYSQEKPVLESLFNKGAEPKAWSILDNRKEYNIFYCKNVN